MTDLSAERCYFALMRSKAPRSQRSQRLITVHTYGPPKTAEAVARLLISEAQKQFQCDVRELIVDKVV